MDDRRFDHLTRALAAALSRRALTGAALVAAARLAAGAGEEAAAKKRRKKKKKPAVCPNRTCLNKVCGQDDGCGGKCTVQAGCESDEACINGGCIANVCNPACTGNHVCNANGSCTCPPSLKECPGPGFGDNCHECCPDALGGDGDDDCEGSAKGAYCKDLANDGELLLTCGCFSTASTCPNGTCGGCCGLTDCFGDYFGEGPVDTGRDCVVVNQQTGEFGCKCRSGTTLCPGGGFCAAPGNRRACGPSCEWCGFRTDYEPNYVCTGNPQRCCLPTGALCALANQDCCAGLNECKLNQQLGTFTCA